MILLITDKRRDFRFTDDTTKGGAHGSPLAALRREVGINGPYESDAARRPGGNPSPSLEY